MSVLCCSNGSYGCLSVFSIFNIDDIDDSQDVEPGYPCDAYLMPLQKTVVIPENNTDPLQWDLIYVNPNCPYVIQLVGENQDTIEVPPQALVFITGFFYLQGAPGTSVEIFVNSKRVATANFSEGHEEQDVIFSTDLADPVFFSFTIVPTSGSVKFLLSSSVYRTSAILEKVEKEFTKVAATEKMATSSFVWHDVYASLYALWDSKTRQVAVTGMERSRYPDLIPGMSVQYRWFKITGHLFVGDQDKPLEISLASQGRNCAFSEPIPAQVDLDTGKPPLRLTNLVLTIGDAQVLVLGYWKCNIGDLQVFRFDDKLKPLEFHIETRLTASKRIVPVQLTRHKGKRQHQQQGQQRKQAKQAKQAKPTQEQQEQQEQEEEQEAEETEIALPYPGNYLISGSWPLDTKWFPVLSAQVYWQGHPQKAKRWSVGLRKDEKEDGSSCDNAPWGEKERKKREKEKKEKKEKESSPTPPLKARLGDVDKVYDRQDKEDINDINDIEDIESIDDIEDIEDIDEMDEIDAIINGIKEEDEEDSRSKEDDDDDDQDDDDDDDDDGEGKEDGDEEEKEEEIQKSKKHSNRHGNRHGDRNSDKHNEKYSDKHGYKHSNSFKSRLKRMSSCRFYSIVAPPPRPPTVPHGTKLMMTFEVMPFPYIAAGPSLDTSNMLQIRRLYLPRNKAKT